MAWPVCGFNHAQLGNYHPLVDTMYWVEAKLWGQEVFGYHLVTIALHVASALLLVKILGKLQIRGAWLAAAILLCIRRSSNP